MGNPRGIDVSRIGQGDNFDWKAHPGLSFGMAKATEGDGFADGALGHNWDAMWWYQPDHRLPRFAYHFFRAGQDPLRQAAFFTQTVRAHGLLPGDNLVLDLEATRPDGTNDGVPAAETARRAVQFLHAVNEACPGHRVLCYSYPGFIEAGNLAGMGGWHLWIAEYDVTAPRVPQPWSRWTFWQDSATPIDTDQYDGDLCSLLAFTRMPDQR